MDLFNYDSYKKYVLDRINARPKRGRGELRKIAAALRVHTTLVSQIFRGDRELTPEQAVALAQHLELTPLESEYFVALIERARAGSQALRGMIDRRLASVRERAAKLSERLEQDRQLSESEKAVFYSSWLYSGIRMATGLPDLTSVEAIARYWGIPREKAGEVLEFLLTHGLCVRDENGRLALGPKRIHVGSDSPFVQNHHRNWRLRAMERHAILQPDELAFTAPLTLSKRDFGELRKLLLEMIDRLSERVADSDSEIVACLNLDWVRFG